MKALLLVLGLTMFGNIAIGQDEPAPAGEVVMDMTEVTKPDAELELQLVEKAEPEMTSGWLATVVAWMLGLQIILRGLAEGLTRISVKTATKWDNKVAAWLSQLAWILGVALGKLGYSVPRLVMEEKARQIGQSKKGS